MTRALKMDTDANDIMLDGFFNSLNSLILCCYWLHNYDVFASLDERFSIVFFGVTCRCRKLELLVLPGLIVYQSM